MIAIWVYIITILGLAKQPRRPEFAICS